MTATPETRADASGGTGPTTGTALVSTLVLTTTTLVATLVTAGGVNPVQASLALLPLAAALGYWRGARWAPVAAVLAVLALLPTRAVELSFDLTRPGDAVPFAVSALTVLAAGTALTTAVLYRSERTGSPSRRRSAIGVLLGAALGAVLGLGMVLASPQADDTGDLTDAEVAALPTVDMVNFRFEPGQLRVAEGQPVAFRFTNDTDKSHSFAVEALGIDTTVPSGRTRTVVVEADAGTYPFVCTVGDHEENGMVGSLIVVGPGGNATDGEDAADTEQARGTGHEH